MFRKLDKKILASLAKSPAKFMMLCALREQLRSVDMFKENANGVLVCIVPDGWLWHAKSAATLMIDEGRSTFDDNDLDRSVFTLYQKPKTKGPEAVPILKPEGQTIYLATSIELVSVSLKLSADAIVDIKAPSGRHFNFARRAIGLKRVPRDIADAVAACPAEVVIGLAARKKIDDLNTTMLAELAPVKEPVHNKKTAPTLSALPGYRAARSWVADLKTDIEGWRNGDVEWADVDKGILLTGAPGTGKTFFAEALAGELGFDFVSTSVAAWQGSEGGNLGTTIAAMRASFHEASSRKGAVLFVDELDSLGDRNRSERRHSYYEGNVINSFLELTTGLAHQEGTVLVAATNYVDLIDSAVLRSGRLEEHVHLDLPDELERAEILSYHLDRILSPTELKKVTDRLSNSTPADFERLARHAKRAARSRSEAVTLTDVEAVIPKRVLIDEDTLRRVAVHEAGHALAALGSGFVNSVTIRVESSVADHLHVQKGGSTKYQMRELTIPTDKHLLAQLRIKLGGMAAEDVVFGSKSTGAGGNAGSDLDVATRIAFRFAGSYGLGKSLRYHGDVDSFAHGDRTGSELKAEVDSILLREYRVIKELLSKEKVRLLTLAAELVVSGELQIEKS